MFDNDETPPKLPALPAGNPRNQTRQRQNFLARLRSPSPPPPPRPATASPRGIRSDTDVLADLSQAVQALKGQVDVLAAKDRELNDMYFATKQAIQDKDPRAAKRRLDKLREYLKLLEQSVEATQRGVVQSQERYVKSVSNGPANTAAAGDSPFVNLSARQDLKAVLAKPEIQALMAKHGLNEADVLAIRVFSGSDYTYINSATANQKDRTDRQDWMDKQYRDLLKPKSDRYQFSEQFSAEAFGDLRQQFPPSKKSTFGFASGKDKGKADTRSAFLKLLDVIEKVARQELALTSEELLNLIVPFRNGLGADADADSYRQALQRLVPEIALSMSGHESSLEREKNDPKARAAVQAAEDAKRLQLENYDKGDADSKGSKASLSQEGAAHMAMLMAAMKKLPAIPVTLYRGLHLSVLDFRKFYRDTPVMTYETLTSLSTNPKMAREFTTVGYKAGHVKIFCEVNALLAQDIREISANPGEDERVLLPGARLSIDSVQEVLPGEWEVTMTQLG